MTRFPQRLALIVMAAALLPSPTWAQPASGVRSTQSAEATAPQPPATTAGWVKDLIIYEVATKSFTSPNGPESGTFASLAERLPYLQDLGINAIWLTGHSVGDPRHFYNIWTQYAVIEPDQVAPELGGEVGLKALIDKAHAHGIRVFLDVITHGVMPQSSLVRDKPHWFRGGSWGMVDYDWQGGHLDLDEWWVRTWTDAVLKLGVDGYRLDVNTYRPDLWARIRANTAAAGKPIVVYVEGRPTIPGVHDFTQKALILSHQIEDRMMPAVDDMAGFLAARQTDGAGDYRVQLTYADGSAASGTTRGGGAFGVSWRGFTTDRRSASPKRVPGLAELWLQIDGAAQKPVSAAVVTRLDTEGQPTGERWEMRSQLPREAKVEGFGPRFDVFVSPFWGVSSSVQLSQHDLGWMGFPADANPYAAEGSRAVFGYAFLFTPLIPIWMAGEEWNATFRPLPTLSDQLYGDRNPGKGKWLYGAQLDWSEIDKPGHREMLDDVRRMIAIRKREAAILGADPRIAADPNIVAVGYDSDITAPRPYLRWTDGVGILVAANRDAGRVANLTLDVPLGTLGQRGARYRLTDLWGQGKPRIVSATALGGLKLQIPRDKTPGGGLAVVKIERVD